MEITELLIRIGIGFIVLFTLTRVLGRKEISQMTFFNFVSAMAIGTLAGSLVIDQTLSITNGIIALTGWAAFTYLMGIIDIKFKKARKLTTGDPLIVIKEGKIIEDSLRQSRLDLDELQSMLRQKNIFSLADVDFAIFEPNGKLSVMPKEFKQPLTKGDMNKESTMKKFVSIPTQVISDGKVLSQNLTKMNLDQNWLEQQLQQAGIHSASDVFYAEVLQDGTLFTDHKDRIVH